LTKRKVTTEKTDEIAKSKVSVKYDLLKRIYQNKHFNHHNIFALKAILVAF
jgi:hypothetical protein